MRPLVSVIMPVYNGAAFIEQALQSVWRQNTPETQFIVVDDGSTDGTAKLLADYQSRLTVISQVNRGAPAARNVGLNRATGDYIGFIDADEQWTEQRLQRQLLFMRAHPDVDVLQERIQHMHLEGKAWVCEQRSFHSMSLSAAFFRRQVFDRIGLLDESMLYCDDMDWFLHAKRAGVNMVQLDDVGLLYKKHEGNLTNQTKLVEHYTLRALLKHRKSEGSKNG